jgi:hypothetical protein
MFSAIGDDGKVYFSGRIADPKSRKYSCKECDSTVSHVRPTVRSLDTIVSEHFRHPAGASHPVIKYTAQKGEMMDFLLDNFGQQMRYKVETDKRFQGTIDHKAVDFAVDLYLSEPLFAGGELKSVIQIESGPFNANDYALQRRFLAANDIHHMLLLSANGRRNPEGYYFNPELRPLTGKIVRKLKDNEKSICERLGYMLYFDHDGKSVKRVCFDGYGEHQPEIVNHRTGFVVPAGFKTFTTLKIPVIKGECRNFGLGYDDQRMIAFPRIVDFLINLEEGDIIGDDERAEKISVMLDSASPHTIKDLSRKYGPERLGGYYQP